MMRYLSISLVLLLFTPSCAPSTHKGMSRGEAPTEKVLNPYFADESVDYVYKARIAAYSKSFGGIMVFKKLSDGVHRIVFTTEFGNKVFDLMLDNGVLTKNFVIPDLDRGMLIELLRRDFDALLTESHIGSKLFRSSTHEVILVSEGKGKQYHFFAKKDLDLERIVRRNWRKETVEIRFQETQGDIARSVTINHYNHPLTIELNMINN